MTTAIVTGATGQDGFYMAELLLESGFNIVAMVRDVDTARQALPRPMVERIDLVEWDMRDQHGINNYLTHFQPAQMYNFAAYSSGAGMFDDPVGIGDINGLAVARILEAIRRYSPSTRFCQASSSEMFGYATKSPQTERTGFHPRTPYGSAKLYAHNMIDIYRRQYGVFACSAILYNHESPRRGESFVTRKVARAAAAIKLGLADELTLGTLDARRDWGYARDYVAAMRLMLEHREADDYVVATGITHSIGDLCECAFDYLNLNYREYVRVQTSEGRAPESVQLVGNASKIRRVLGWEAKMKFEDLIRLMVDHELEAFNNSA